MRVVFAKSVNNYRGKIMSNLTTISEQDGKLIKVLQSSLYPGATDASVSLVMDYCRAAQLDPLQKPVHIVPMWDSKAQGMRDVIMPGVGLYRIQAARTGRFAGMTEPEFGPDVTATIGGLSITYPEWARVTVRRILDGGHIAEFTAIEFWLENYAVKGGKEKSIAPNAMWARRPKGQLGKCASAQALRLAFPEIGAQPTFEEMEGKEIDISEPEKIPAQRAGLSKSFIDSLAVTDCVDDLEPQEQPAISAINYADESKMADFRTLIDDAATSADLAKVGKDISFLSPALQSALRVSYAAKLKTFKAQVNA